MVVLAHEGRHSWQYFYQPHMTYDEGECDAYEWTLQIFDQCPSDNPVVVEFKSTVQDSVDIMCNSPAP
jgi:hypothetical protein